MIAAPPVRGLRERSKWLLGLLLYSTSLVAGALTLGVALQALHEVVPLPSIVLGVMGVSLAVYVAYRPTSVLITSPWRVPRSWHQLGSSAFSSVFGAILGFGLLTSLPSSGFYMIVGWGLSASALGAALVVFFTYAVGRLLPLLVVAMQAAFSGEYPETRRINLSSSHAHYAESSLLAATGIALLTTAILR